jgi:hypothetical protein
MEDLVITLELKVPEVNAVLQALAKLPYENSATVIEKIRAQGDPQVAAVQDEQPKE